MFTFWLLGDSTDDYWAFSAQTCTGNKALVVTGTLNLHGAPRAMLNTVLTSDISPTDTQMSLEDASGLLENYPGSTCSQGPNREPKGDTLVVSSSTMDTGATEFCEIDNVSGNLVECKNPHGSTTQFEFRRFHFGQSTSTGPLWEGIDMRAEVAVLDRWITIRAETDYMSDAGYTGHDEEPWGCRILVSDWFDTGAGLQHRKGKVHMDYVEIRGCS